MSTARPPKIEEAREKCKGIANKIQDELHFLIEFITMKQFLFVFFTSSCGCAMNFEKEMSSVTLVM